MAVREYTGSDKLRDTRQTGAVPRPRLSAWIRDYLPVAVVSLLLSGLVVHETAGKIPDDAYIMFRYAQNLLDGHGWVYNLQHPTTNAVSAPLYTLVLVALGALVGGIERAATLLFVLTTALSGFLAFAILRKNSMTLGGIAAMLLMVFNPWLLATRSLETSAFVSLLLLSVLLQGAGRYGALGFTLVAATLVRGDGAVLSAVVFVFLWTQAKRPPWRLMLGAGTAVTLWAVTALIVKIPIIPDTLDAKIAQGRSGLWGDMLYLRGGFLTPRVFGFMEWATVAALLAGAGLLLICGSRELRRYLGPFVIGVFLIFAAYGLIIRPPTYHWYYGPQLALMALCGGIAITIIGRAAGSLVQKLARAADSDLVRPHGRHDITRLGNAVAIIVTVVLTATVTLVGWRGIIRGADRPEYLEAASWLSANTPADATVALSEIGIVGWYSEREMIDFLGLLSKDSVHEIAKHDSVSWLSREEPDYWVVHQPPWPGMEAAAREPWFTLAYAPVWTDHLGKVAAWKRFRSITEAKSLFEEVIRPVSNRIIQQLGVPASDEATRISLSTLIALLSVRDDLRRAYVSNNRFDLAGLLAWAAGPAVGRDQFKAIVHGYSSSYQQIAPRAEHLSFDTPPSTR